MGTMYRHITNTSNQPWTFEPEYRDGANHGNIYFSDLTSSEGIAWSDGNHKNGPFTLGPKCSVKIQYTTTDGMAGGFWKITDHKGKSHNDFHYYCDNGEAPYIKHNNKTGIAFNDPANGDISAWGDQW